LGETWLQAWALSEAKDGHVRKPRTCLSPVEAQLLQASLQAVREPRRLARRVLEDQHSDRSGLAVAHRHERERGGCCGRLAQGADDGRELGAPPGAETGERDVKAVHDSASGELL